jgi:hypothetical protein
VLTTLSEVHLVPAPNGEIHVELTFRSAKLHAKMIVNMTDEFRAIVEAERLFGRPRIQGGSDGTT